MKIADSIDASNPGLQNARRLLRAKQKRAGLEMGISRPVTNTSPVDLALQRLRDIKQFQATDSPQIVRRGVFTFDRQLEEKRLRWAEGIIRRVDPGPFEDPTFLALLAYQAASVEMSAPMMVGDASGEGDQWSAFILGTIPSFKVNAFATVHSGQAYTVVEVHAALIDFIYQSAKAIVAAQQPARATDSRSAVVTTTATESILSALRENPEPADHLYRTLEAYFFNGVTRAVRKEQVPLEHQPPIALLVNMAERFVVAHEYGHGRTSGIIPPNANVKAKWVPELLADAYAVATTVLSGSMLDRLAPEFSLAGGVFSLTCLSLLGQAFHLLRDGQIPEDAGSDCYPPFALRTAQLLNVFYTFFDVEYDDSARQYKLRLIQDRRYPKEPSDNARRHIEGGSYSSARTLLMLWTLVKEKLLKDHINKRPLHPLWSKAI